MLPEMHKLGPACDEDDFESLCYTMYSLEIGVQKWLKLKPRPTVRELKQQSEVVQLICSECHCEFSSDGTEGEQINFSVLDAIPHDGIKNCNESSFSIQ
jgi:hypothetical protein